MIEDFNEYMKNFKDYPLKEKQSIVYEQLQMLASFTNSLCKELNIPNEILMNRELLDLKKENYTEDDFAEAIIVLINSIQNSICDYSGGISDLLDKFEESQNGANQSSDIN
jgi:hypothetical protein